MKIKDYRYIAVLVIGFILTLVAYLLFIHSPFFPEFQAWIYQHILILDLTLIVIKIIGVIWPPLTGLVLTIGAIPIIGWPHAFIVDSIGNVVGSVIVYYMSRKWGLKFMSKIFDQTVIDKITSIKTVENRELEAILIFRILGGGLTELVCYAAGFYKVKFKNFIIGILISNFLVGVLLFYLADRAFNGTNAALAFSPLIVAVILFILLRKRYFKPNYPNA